MRRLFLALLASTAAGAAAAQVAGSSYNVQGTKPNGQQYTGTAQITPTGSACRITWQTGSTSSSGICMLANKAFAAFDELQPKGSLKGWWTIADSSGVGTEVLTRR